MRGERGARPPTLKPQVLCLLAALPSALASEALGSCFQGSSSRLSHKKHVLGKMQTLWPQRRDKAIAISSPGRCRPFRARIC